MTGGVFERMDRGAVVVVAEIGNNHEGDFDLAREMVRAAARCGVDAVKFQTVRAAGLVSPADAVRYERLKSFELSEGEFAELAGLARAEGVLFLSTPLDLASADFLRNMVDAYKIASGDNDFLPLLDRVAGTGKPVLVSTGLLDLDGVRRTVEFVRGAWSRHGVASGRLAVLHCVSAYPVPPGEASLRSIPFLAERLDVPVGYSDHTLGTDAALAAVALGARVVEKHFTTDKKRSDFRDHQLSADPGEMRELVERIRRIVPMLGRFEKRVQPCEREGLSAFRRSIVAARDLSPGGRVGLGDLAWLRPAGGLEAGREHLLVGRILRRGIRAGERLGPGDVE